MDQTYKAKCIVRRHSRRVLFGLFSISRDKKQRVEIDFNGFKIEDEYLPRESISSIELFEAEKVATKFNHGIYIRREAGDIFLYVDGLKAYPSIPKTREMISFVKKMFRELLNK